MTTAAGQVLDGVLRGREDIDVGKRFVHDPHVLRGRAARVADDYRVGEYQERLRRVQRACSGRRDMSEDLTSFGRCAIKWVTQAPRTTPMMGPAMLVTTVQSIVLGGVVAIVPRSLWLLSRLQLLL